MIYQNDQYYLQVGVKQNQEVVKDTDCEEMIIKIGGVSKRKSTGELIFSSFKNCWLYPLKYSHTTDSKLNGKLPCQAWFRTSNGNFYDSNVVTIKLNASIINKDDLGDLNGN